MESRTLDPKEIKNFIKNVTNYMYDNWMTMTDLSDQVRGHYDENFIKKFELYKNGEKKPKYETIQKFAAAMDCTVEKLLGTPSKNYLPSETNYFKKEAIKYNYKLRTISFNTGLSTHKFIEIIYNIKGKFNQKQLLQLQKMGFSLPTLVPFAEKNVNLRELIANRPIHEAHQWYYRRKAIMLMAGGNAAKLSASTGIPVEVIESRIFLNYTYYTPSNLAAPLPNEYNLVLDALNLKGVKDEQLILTGRFLNHPQHLKQLVECEALFKEYALKTGKENLLTTIKNIKIEELLELFLKIKQGMSIPEIMQFLGSKKFIVITSCLLTALLKSAPVVAAEITAAKIQPHLEHDAKVALEKNHMIEAFVAHLGSHLNKFILLILRGYPKGLENAILKSERPSQVFGNFLKADGYAESIVNDWKKLLDWALSAKSEPVKSLDTSLVQPTPDSREEKNEYENDKTLETKQETELCEAQKAGLEKQQAYRQTKLLSQTKTATLFGTGRCEQSEKMKLEAAGKTSSDLQRDQLYQQLTQTKMPKVATQTVQPSDLATDKLSSFSRAPKQEHQKLFAAASTFKVLEITITCPGGSHPQCMKKTV